MGFVLNSMTVPKTIYQTWFTKSLPLEVQSTIDHMMCKNKSYTYELFDDNDMESFVKNNYEQKIFDCYKKLTIGAAKADFWRYLILYKNGGVYLDVDSVIYDSIDSLVADGYSVVSREGNPNKFVQWMLIFTPEHPILKTCIDKCVQNISCGKVVDVTELTGPVVYSDSIREVLNDSSCYYKSDEQLNQLSDKNGVMFHSFDYRGYANFENPYKNLLYKNKVHWRNEQQMRLTRGNYYEDKC